MSGWRVAGSGWAALAVFLAGDVIDFAHRPTDGYRLLDVIDGKLSADPY